MSEGAYDQEAFDSYKKERFDHYRNLPGYGKQGAKVQAHQSADRHFRESGAPGGGIREEAGYDFLARRPDRQRPAEDDPTRPFGKGEAIPESKYRMDVEGNFIHDKDPYLEAMFAKAGGTGERGPSNDDDDSDQPAQSGGARKDLSGWQRTGHFFKGLWNAARMPFNLIYNGLFGANYRRGQTRKAGNKKLAIDQQMADPAIAADPLKHKALGDQSMKAYMEKEKHLQLLKQNRAMWTGQNTARHFKQMWQGRSRPEVGEFGKKVGEFIKQEPEYALPKTKVKVPKQAKAKQAKAMAPEAPAMGISDPYEEQPAMNAQQSLFGGAGKANIDAYGRHSDLAYGENGEVLFDDED
jgi:hypothetical protein